MKSYGISINRVLIVLCLVLILFLTYFSFVSAQKYDIGNALLKVSIKQGDFTERFVKISASEDGDFTLQVVGLEEVRLGSDQFSLKTGESKNVNLYFNATTLKPGVYTGSIKVVSGKDIAYLPVVFEVEAKNLFFDSNLEIPVQYLEVEPGGRILAQVKIFDLTGLKGTSTLGPTTVNVDYELRSYDGRTLSSESEEVIVDRQVQVTKTLSLPKNIDSGDYFYIVVVTYKTSIGTSSQLFAVKSNRDTLGFSDWRFLAIFIFVAILFVGMIILFIYLMRDRDKMVSALKRYNDLEMNNHKKILHEHGKILEEKGHSKESIKDMIKNKIFSLRSKHNSRINEMKSLKKEGKISEMQKKLNEWKKEGYNATGLNYIFGKHGVENLLKEKKRKKK